MASRNGSGDIPRPERTQSPAQKQLESPDNSSPDSEQVVIDQTADVFQNFLYQSWRQDMDKENFRDQVTPIPQLTNFTQDPLSATAQVGRRLAKIGDDIQEKYAREFDHLIDDLKVDKNTAYDAFAGVAKKLVEGGLNWGRIASLFSFGYRIFVRVIGIGAAIKDFSLVLRNIVRNIVTFVKDTATGIARWIASQGGWGSAMEYQTSVGWRVIGGITFAAAASLAAVFYLKSGR
ncbi:fibroblast apoptotic process [Mactra antiquata]